MKIEKKDWMYSDTKVKNFESMPDQYYHRLVSFIKSAVRIIGYMFIPVDLLIATVFLVLSEVIGILEELV